MIELRLSKTVKSLVSKTLKPLQNDTYKKFSITGENLNHGKFEIKGVSNLVQSNDSVTFFFKGNINEIIKILAELKIKDVLIEEPTLEERRDFYALL